jgi:predicted nuclease of predicted toxin-antitoxin system
VKRLLLDQGLAPHAATILNAHGFEAVHVAELGMERAEDAVILEIARNESRVCVTLDHDFTRTLLRPGTRVLR